MRLNHLVWRYPLLLAFTLSAVFLYITTFSKTPFFLSAQFKTGDTLFRGALKEGSLELSEEIVVIGVDNESMHRLDRSWPWGREIFAVFLDRIRPLNPKVIGFDFSFAGKSQNEEADRWFAEEIAKSGNVILASYFDRDSINPPYAYIPPEALFLKSAKASGFINVPYDQDGTVRRSRMVLKLADHGFVYSFPVQLACAYKGLLPQKSVQIHGRNIFFRLPSKEDPAVLGDIPVPLDRKYHIPISFRYSKKQISYIPFWKIIAGQVNAQEIEGKIALVGITSDFVHDTHETPLGLMPGVFILAQQTLMILKQDFVTKLWPYNHWIFLMALTFVFSLVFYRLTYIQGLVMLVLTEWAIHEFSVWLFTAHRLIFNIFSTMFVLILVFLLTLFFKGLLTFLENATLQRQVITDGLTGLYNHNYIPQRLGAEFERYRKTDKEFFFVMADIDLFKKINDTYGHEQGNKVLVEIAECLKKGTRKTDVVARYGGEEFCIILLDCDQEGAKRVMEKIRVAIEASAFANVGKSFRVTISAGICSNKTQGIQRSSDIIHLADQSLYEAKAAGRNRICIHPLTA